MPRIFARPDLPSGPGNARVTPDSFGVGAINSFGAAAGALGETFRRIEDASVEAESRRLIQETQAKIEDSIKQNDLAEVDPEKYHETTSRSVREIYDLGLGSTKNERVQARYRDSLSPYMIRSQTAIDLDRTKKKVEMAEANFAQYLDGASQRLGHTDDPVKRAELEKEIVEVVTAAVQTRTIKPKDGVTTIAKIRDDAQNERVSWGVLTDPEGLLRLLKDPNALPGYTGAKRVAVEQRALEAIREKRIAGERLDQERLNKMSDDLLVRSTAPGANLTAMREEVRNMKDASPKFVDFRKFWLDRFDHRIASMQAGEGDPFAKSDGQVKAQVMLGVLNEPEKWNQGDIDRYVGRGLSVTDAQSYKKMLKDAHEGKAGDKEPMKQALATWERMRRGGYFLPPDKRPTRDKPMPMNDVLRNDAAAQQVWDSVMEESKKPGAPSPQVILQQKMKPFNDETVKGWLGNVLSFGASIGVVPQAWAPDPNSPTQSEAVEFLLKNKQPVTQKNVEAYETQKATRTPAAPVTAPGVSAGSAATGTMVSRGLGVSPPAGPSTVPPPPEPPPPVQKNRGTTDWDVRRIGEIQDWYMGEFGKPLPVTAAGMTQTHAGMGFDHSKAVDVGVNPASEQGRRLVNYLRTKGIPFIAFDRAIPGQSTGPHIHIGKPSQRIARLTTSEY